MKGHQGIHQGIVEGFEGDYCKIEIAGNIEAIPRSKVDSRVKQGDVVEWSGSKWISNSKMTHERSREMKKLMDDVWED
ncbi:DUF3006 domain-containing protein [Paenibacillus sp. KQZ6P-2]|uniref:DUF3006 domain-containing protein n=1 Tax=Paenibacillus mangrovi TaxID=2931978 RepID=A0A9X1WKU1_9BACL|nr:DUF3006 domain-containing protein [Paenibacillus mangrovi]